MFFRPAKASAKQARSARNARGGKALHTLFTLALACKRQTYFRSSLLSLRSDDRKYVCCSQAALASSSETQGQSVGSIKCSWWKFTAILMFYFWRGATAALVPGFLCQSGRRRPENVSILSSLFLLAGIGYTEIIEALNEPILNFIWRLYSSAYKQLIE